MEEVKDAWAKYKTADKSCSTTCGCEVEGVKFCRHDNGGSCDLCSKFNEVVECGYDGLPNNGIESCKKYCFPGDHLLTYL